MKLAVPRSRPRLAIVAALVGILVVGFLLLRGRGPEQGGPLGPYYAHGSLSPVRLGHAITDGLEQLRLRGDEPATISRIEVVGGSDALQFLGAMLAGPGRYAPANQEYKSYPPRSSWVAGTLMPAIGAVIEPTSKPGYDRGYELLLGYRYIADKLAARSVIRIYYTVDGHDYVVEDPARLVACPTTTSDDECLDYADQVFPHG